MRLTEPYCNAHVVAVNKMFGSNLNGYRGVSSEKGGRLLTGIRLKLWNLSTGMNHAKGFSIFIDLPINWDQTGYGVLEHLKNNGSVLWKNFSQAIKRFY